MSVTGDMTGIAGVWIVGKKVSTDDQPAKGLSFRLAFSVSIKAPKGHQVSFEKNRKFIRWLREVGFNVKGITSDTYQSYDLQQQLKAEGYACEMLSVDRVTDGVCQPYQYLRSAIYEKRFHMYKSNRLFDEFVDIERNNNTGKIDHSPNGHKDALDAVCGATFNASKHAEEYAFDHAESLELTNDINKTGVDTASAQQIAIDFEQEMQKLLDPVQVSIADESKTQTVSDVGLMDFGLGKAQPVSFVADGIIVW